METQGTVEVVKHDNTGVKLETGEWYSSFNDKVNCNKGDKVKITYTDNTSNGRTYHNFDKIEVIESAPQGTDTFAKARESKDASQLTAYAKDLVVAVINNSQMPKLGVDELMPEAAKAVAEAYNQIKDIISGKTEKPEKEKSAEPIKPEDF